MQDKVFPFPRVTITQPMAGCVCNLCDHKPFFVEEDVFWQHMEEVHAVFRFSPNDSPDGGLGDVLKNILSLRPSPNQTKKMLVISSRRKALIGELLKKMGFKYE